MNALLYIQDSAFATWIRESSWAIFALLIVHTIGMGALVGTGVVANMRGLGAASQLPASLRPMLRPIVKWALLAASLSGILLMIAYPAKALLNPIFYVKFLIIGTAMALTSRARAWRTVDAPPPARQRFTAAAALMLWAAAVLAGKLLEYTHRVLLLY